MRRIEEGVPIYSGMSLRGRPEVALPRLRRPGSIEAPILLGQIRSSDSSCGRIFAAFIYP